MGTILPCTVPFTITAPRLVRQVTATHLPLESVIPLAMVWNPVMLGLATYSPLESVIPLAMVWNPVMLGSFQFGFSKSMTTNWVLATGPSPILGGKSA